MDRCPESPAQEVNPDAALTTNSPAGSLVTELAPVPRIIAWVALMRRSEKLNRLQGNAPCLLCGPVAAELARLGFADFAFLLPHLASAIWGSPNLSTDHRVRINSVLTGLVRSYNKPRDERSRLAHAAREVLLTLAAKTPLLAETIEDALLAFEEPPDPPQSTSPCPSTSPHGA